MPPPNAFVEIKSIKLEITFSFHPSKLKSGLWLVDSLLGQLIRSLVYTKHLCLLAFCIKICESLQFTLSWQITLVMIRQKIVVYPEMIGKSNFVYYWLPIFSKKKFHFEEVETRGFPDGFGSIFNFRTDFLMMSQNLTLYQPQQ